MLAPRWLGSHLRAWRRAGAANAAENDVRRVGAKTDGVKIVRELHNTVPPDKPRCGGSWWPGRSVPAHVSQRACNYTLWFSSVVSAADRRAVSRRGCCGAAWRVRYEATVELLGEI